MVVWCVSVELKFCLSASNLTEAFNTSLVLSPIEWRRFHEDGNELGSCRMKKAEAQHNKYLDLLPKVKYLRRSYQRHATQFHTASWTPRHLHLPRCSSSHPTHQVIHGCYIRGSTLGCSWSLDTDISPRSDTTPCHPVQGRQFPASHLFSSSDFYVSTFRVTNITAGIPSFTTTFQAPTKYRPSK